MKATINNNIVCECGHVMFMENEVDNSRKYLNITTVKCLNPHCKDFNIKYLQPSIELEKYNES
jgi:hypothetical protein